MKYINNVLDHPKRETIEQRLEIIKFFDDYGAEATKRAFGKSRSTIFLWKQKLKKSGGKLSALAPGDKTTITPVLAVACQRAVIKPVSESTVGRIIHDLKEKGRLPKSTKITINGRTGKLMVREPKLRKKKARRRGFCPQKPGDLIQMDTISIFTDGLKRYIFTAIDVNTRFAFAYAYKSNSSACGSDFLAKFLKVTPFATRRVQTDNGSEFAKHFEQCCQEKGLVHFFNYPKHPEANGHLERFNRTIQEQFANRYTDYLDEPKVFNQKLMEYLIWYNTEKPHRSIGNLPPLRYYLDNFFKTPEKSNMLWTLTSS